MAFFRNFGQTDWTVNAKNTGIISTNKLRNQIKMEPIEEWIKPIQFRRRLEISGVAYRNARKDGRIFEKKVGSMVLVEWNSSRRKFIDTSRQPLRYTDEEIQKRLDERLNRKHIAKHGSPPASEKKSGNEKAKETAESLLNSEELENDDEFSNVNSKRNAEAIKQHYLAKQAKLRFLKDAGVLMETTQVKKEWEALAVQVRKLVMGVPDRVSELFASMSDSREIQDMLTKELFTCLTNLKYEIKRTNEENI